MIFNKCALFLFILPVIVTSYEEPECDKDLRDLGAAEAHFIQCAIDNAKISQTCIPCADAYRSAVSFYETLFAKCSDKFFNKNRLNIVYNIHEGLTEIWNRGYCDDCFENGSTTQRSNSTLRFQDLLVNHTNCVAKNLPSPCSNCSGTYFELNKYYRKMDEEKKGNICFDLQDSMNQTRLAWSKKYKCCRREISMALFIVGTSIFGTIPLIFYFGMYAYTKRMETNHDHLDTNFDTENHAAIASTSGVSSSRLNHSVENQNTAVEHDDANILESSIQDTRIRSQTESRLIEL